ncbi:MAG: hypothetical protein LBQ52_02735, partial [Helicobacteraceae bacterium]|nr:hypothetical protein [Helicobacteraceae bacterium]
MITDRDLNEALQRSAVRESVERRIPTSEIGYTLALVKDLVDRLVEMESIPPEMIKAMVEI